MDRDAFLRRTLRVTAVVNLVAALVFAFPASLGRIAGLPAPVPALYSASFAVLVALFGCTYGWLARQPAIDRPLIAFSAIGKASFVTVALVCWIFGAVPFLTVLFASADLVFAAIFVSWLLGENAATIPARSQTS